jgi:hypothetical protein
MNRRIAVFPLVAVMAAGVGIAGKVAGFSASGRYVLDACLLALAISIALAWSDPRLSVRVPVRSRALWTEAAHWFLASTFVAGVVLCIAAFVDFSFDRRHDVARHHQLLAPAIVLGSVYAVSGVLWFLRHELRNWQPHTEGVGSLPTAQDDRRKPRTRRS